MKVILIQPKYSTDYAKSDEFFQKELEYLDACDESADLIVMPESCDVPCLAHTKEESEASVRKYNKPLLEKAAETAKRCKATLFLNARYETEAGLRNTTYAFNKEGKIAGMYFKEHLVPSEVNSLKLDCEYGFEHSAPTVIEIDGIRYGFLICYDFYFYEMFPNIARQNVDIIIGCSHQRSDTHHASEVMSSFLAYNTNAHVVRTSVCMDENSDIGGGSLVANPRGEVLINMKSSVGLATVEFDPQDKYYKPAGYGNPPAAHYEYIEQGRRPWKYRPGGSAICRTEEWMRYPRVCAHRGFNTIAPENSMPAFGAAVAMGAEEIEFDLWYTKDGEIVSIHDASLERVSDGEGFVFDKTYEELLVYDFGVKHGDKFRGLKILTFEEILKKLACHTIMNIHIKTLDDYCDYDENHLKKIIALIDKYDCRKHVYFMCGNDKVLEMAQRLAPDICRCCGETSATISDGEKTRIVERAIQYNCQKVQFFKPFFTQADIDKAHENGISCNVFFADTEEETEKYLKMGIDTILTNDYNIISQVVKKFQ